MSIKRIAPQFASSTRQRAFPISDVIGGPSSGLYAANTGEGTQIDTSTEHGKESLAKEAPAAQIDLPEVTITPDKAETDVAGTSATGEGRGEAPRVCDDTMPEVTAGGGKTEGAPEEPRATLYFFPLFIVSILFRDARHAKHLTKV